MMQRPLRLTRRLTSARAFWSFALSGLCGLAALLAAVPLGSVLWMLLVEGGRNLSLSVLTDLPPAALAQGGGFGNALVGTLIMVGIAALLSVPVGVATAVYLSELARGTREATLIHFLLKVLSGLPSILAGVFAFAVVVVTTRSFSAVAGGVALSILMLPIVALTAEEALRQVQTTTRMAAVGLGATASQVVFQVVLPEALPNILTGVMLAVARAAGETAPLLFTALFSSQWPSGQLLEPTASMSVLIYNFSSVPYENQKQLAWTAALVLVGSILALNIFGQLFARRRAR